MQQLRNGELAHQLATVKGAANQLCHALDQKDKWPASDNAKRYRDDTAAKLLAEIQPLQEMLDELTTYLEGDEE